MLDDARVQVAIVMLLVGLTACQSSSAVPFGAAGNAVLSNDVSAPANDPNCGYEDQPGLRDKGGTIQVPVVPTTGNFGGYFDYTRIMKDPHVVSEFASCSDNSFNIPVPAGYIPDWFGWWNVCNGSCSFSFETGSVKSRLQSTTWVPKMTYYLYVYATTSGTLIESYPIGAVKARKELLTFASPFANGFTWPTNDTVSLEIVHASEGDSARCRFGAERWQWGMIDSSPGLFLC